MKIQSILSCLFSFALAVLIAGCASTQSEIAKQEHDVTLAQVSEPARTTVTQVTTNGQVDKITREIERGKTVYDVEVNVNGQHREYLIAEADGEILGTEVPIEFNQLPEPVRAATEKYFGTTTGLTIMKAEEYGETYYEIEGPKRGKTVEITLDPTGKRSE